MTASTSPFPRGFSTRRFSAGLALALSPAALLAGGTGTEGDPFTGADVPATMDGGYFLLDGAKDLGSLPWIGSTGRAHLTLQGGAAVTSQFFGMGLDVSAALDPDESNTLDIDGTGTSLTVAKNLFLGYAQPGNEILVSGGASLTTGGCVLGYQSSSNSGNYLAVKNPGSLWTSTASVYVGNLGSGFVTISQGAAMKILPTSFVVDENYYESCALYVGYASSSTTMRSSAVTITGAGSSLTIGDGSGSPEIPIFVGYSGIGYLYVVDGATLVSDNGLTIGYESMSRYVGSNMSVVGVSGSGSSMSFAGPIICGYGAGLTQFAASSGATVTCDSLQIGLQNLTIQVKENDTNTTVVKSASSDFNQVVVQGAGTVLTTRTSCGVGIGGNSNFFFVVDGGKVVCPEGLVVGIGSVALQQYGEGVRMGSDNTALAIGDNSIIDATGGPVSLGVYGSDNNLVTASGALVKGNLLLMDMRTPASGNKVSLAGGYLAFSGDQTAMFRSLADAGKIYRWDPVASEGTGAYVPAAYSDLTVTYCETEAEGKAATAHGSFAGYDGLAGFTVATAGASKVNLLWAKPDYYKDGWYCSWYGWFATNYNWGDGWIAHADHGWQWMYSGSTPEHAYLWDCATASWWYTDAASYPWMYDYTLEMWLYYKSGAAPQRLFSRDGTDGNARPESELVPRG
jgi:T5SS/PEP-CTERM-associated repeat protein